MPIREEMTIRLSVFVVLGLTGAASALGAPPDLVMFTFGVAVGLQLGIDRLMSGTGARLP